MISTGSIAVRTFAWLATTLMPLQSLPSSNCDCSKGHASKCCCGATQSAGAASRRTCCCSSKQTVRNTCCGHQAVDNGDRVCRCGTHCSCRQPQEPQPTAPTHSNKTVEQILATAVSVASSIPAEQCEQGQQTPIQDRNFSGMSALANCISLNRFIL